MINSDLARATWHKSTRSGSDSDCVEVTEGVRVVGVRDSKDPSGPILVFARTSWTAFIADTPHQNTPLS
ncbi:DUF397 domain-containing protein [Micromonospora sp. SH-82]|uniref:DUF397 domain-containing protein n=1 Tax=Micromonospora sp. SH-82 TaxID=3132938 RepID=UPI003EB8A239